MKVGILWRGELGAQRPAEDRGLAPLFDALAELAVDIVPVPYSDEHVEQVREQLLELGGVLVWVNPIQDGADRRHVDDLLWDAATRGIWVSAHPDVVGKIGTKEVLFETRHLGWGSDVALYRSADELGERLPDRLATHARLVVKQGRGNGGNGVWSVELVDLDTPATLRSAVFIREALAKESTVERVTLGEFVERSRPYFSWSGVFVDQEYQSRLADGMVRCYLSHGTVVGFCRQWPTGLLELDAPSPPSDRPRRVNEGPDVPAFQSLRQRVEDDWVPKFARHLGLDVTDLPVIWDADFLFGTQHEHGADSYVLCEINVSAVWPFPPIASRTIAANTVARVAAAVQQKKNAASEV